MGAVAVVPPTSFQKLSSEQVQAFTTDQVRAWTPEQIKVISSADFISQQMSLTDPVSGAQWGNLSAEQVTAVQPEYFSNMQLELHYMGAQALSYLLEFQIQNVPPEQLQTLDATTIPGLSANQLRVMSDTQVQDGFTLDQMAFFEKHQIEAMANVLSSNQKTALLARWTAADLISLGVTFA